MADFILFHTQRLTAGATTTSWTVLERLRHDERGEGVISAAIAVLIMAFVGVGAFVGFKEIMEAVTDKTKECIDNLDPGADSC